MIVSGTPFLTNGDETNQVLSANVSRLVQFAQEEYGAFVPLYAVAEGNGCKPVLEFMKAAPDVLAGLACVLSASDAMSMPVNGSLPAIVSETGGMMPSAAGSYPVLSLTGNASFLYGLGELGADDVLAANLLGSSRDTDRKQAELTGRKITTWLTMRRVFREDK